MYTTEHEAQRSASNRPKAGGARVDVVDNWHKDWPRVLELINRLGHRDALMLDCDGWVSARQSVLAAFDADNHVAGHLCFRIEPAKLAEHQHSARPAMEAHVDCFGVADQARRNEVAHKLQSAASDLAKTLKLQKVHGLEQVT